MAFLRHYSSDELSRSLHSAADKLGIEDFRAEQIDALKAFQSGQVVLVRGTPTAGVLLHWVVISRRWERIQARDSELPINTDSPGKKKCCDAVA